MNTSRLKLFLEPAVIFFVRPKLVRRFFQRFAHLLGPDPWLFRNLSDETFARRLPRYLAEDTLPEPLVQALHEIEQIAASENWPKGVGADREDPLQYPDAHRLYKAITRWFELHPPTPAAPPSPPSPNPCNPCLPSEPPPTSSCHPRPASGPPPFPSLPSCPPVNSPASAEPPTPPVAAPPAPSLSDNSCNSCPPTEPGPSPSPSPNSCNSCPSAESEPQAILRLARLPLPDYDRCRHAEARKLKLRLRTLDAEVRRIRATIDDLDAAAIRLKPIKPWPRPVNGPDLLTEVSRVFSRHIVLWKGAADVIALWLLHTHCYKAFYQTPRLNFYSRERRCGKSTAIDVMLSFLSRAFKADNVRPAVVYRLAHKGECVLVFDETDSYLPASNELRGLLNAGYQLGGVAYRCEGPGRTVRAFNACAPTVLAGIGLLPATLLDRSILIPMVEAKPGEIPERFDPRKIKANKVMASKLARWAADNFDTLKKCDPPLPPEAFNRLGDNWRPLFAIAQALGGDWPQRILDAFHSLTAATEQIVRQEVLTASPVVTGNPIPNTNGHLNGNGATPVSSFLVHTSRLIDDIRSVFEQTGATRLFASAISEALRTMPDRPYAQFIAPGSPQGPADRWLGHQLAFVGIRSRVLSLGSLRARGYRLEDFPKPAPQPQPAPEFEI